MVEGFQKKVTELESSLGINVMSGPQVISAAKKNGVHIMNTQAETLKGFKNVPFIKSVLEARTYRKAVSTYGLSWLEKSVEDGRVYSSYHITGTETGRMSASDPNMQQIPARVLPEYRTLFVPSHGSVILVSDISQQEPRILAYETKDATLLEALNNKEDLHLAVARAVFNRPTLSKKDADYADKRFVGKTINLGTSYGLSEYGLATRLGITEEEAARFLKNYFARFPDVFNWIQLQRNFGMKHEYVKTALGRRIFLNVYQNQWANNAINAPIQGGAADFTKIWIRKIWERCRKEKFPFFIVAIIHDEIVQDVAKEMVKDAKRIVNDTFQETARKLYPGIPFAYETEMGANWGVKQDSSYSIHEDDL
jgi:DNA polymerase I